LHGCKLVGVRGQCMFPSLESHVSLCESRVCNGNIRWIKSLWSDLGEGEHDTDEAPEG